MAGMKEIRTRIDSVQQTLKITNAMYLISSSKLRKARQQLNRVAPFFAKINETISDILHHTTETQHRFFDKRKYLQERKVGYVVITGDKGLAGAYNHNILRLTEERLAQTDHPVLFLVGQVGRSYFAGRDVSVDKEFLYTAQDPTLLRAEELSDYVIDLFIRGELDEVYVIYTEMVSPMVLEPKVRKMLPLDADAFPWEPRPGEEGLNQQKVTYVPSEAQVLSYLAEGYVKGAIFGTLVESFCAEQNARMMAMDAASSNARDMLKALSLHYNRARRRPSPKRSPRWWAAPSGRRQSGPPAGRRRLPAPSASWRTAAAHRKGGNRNGTERRSGASAWAGGRRGLPRRQAARNQRGHDRHPGGHPAGDGSGPAHRRRHRPLHHALPQ